MNVQKVHNRISQHETIDVSANLRVGHLCVDTAMYHEVSGGLRAVPVAGSTDGDGSAASICTLNKDSFRQITCEVKVKVE